MIPFTTFIDYFLHLDKYLSIAVENSGLFIYALLFIIIFCETGLVVTPFLPGDSLLFAAGSLAALGSLNVMVIFITLAIAAVGGDTANYWIGHFIGPKIFRKKNGLLFSRDHLKKTNIFYKKYGTKTIIFSRFMPIIRTFAPFVAGIGKMEYKKFISYNFIGGIAWVALFVFGGYFFGTIPFVKKNFSLVILAIILLSILPAIVEYIHHHRNKRKNI